MKSTQKISMKNTVIASFIQVTEISLQNLKMFTEAYIPEVCLRNCGKLK